LLQVVLFCRCRLLRKKACFSSTARAEAERTAKVYQEPDPGYDPALGYNPNFGFRAGAPAVRFQRTRFRFSIALPIRKAAKAPAPTPKFYCSVPGVVDENGDPCATSEAAFQRTIARQKKRRDLRRVSLVKVSKALGFFADDEWVADVNCPDCEKSLNKKFQGTSFTGFQPAAGIELPLGQRE
jgi:hypothetical protein